jgi:hypothetical protein
MLIDPDFLTHWRTLTLCDLTGDDHAALYLIRLWGHCQTRKNDVFQIPPAGLKALCQFKGDPDVLENALTVAGFIKREGETVTVLKWSDHNAKLIQCWENGKKGGRPAKPKPNPRKTETEPNGNPTRTQREPKPNPSETNKIRQDKTGLEKSEEEDPRITSAEMSEMVPDGPEPGQTPESEFLAIWNSLPSGKRGVMRVSGLPPMLSVKDREVFNRLWPAKCEVMKAAMDVIKRGGIKWDRTAVTVRQFLSTDLMDRLLSGLESEDYAEPQKPTQEKPKGRYTAAQLEYLERRRKELADAGE